MITAPYENTSHHVDVNGNQLEFNPPETTNFSVTICMTNVLHFN